MPDECHSFPLWSKPMVHKTVLMLFTLIMVGCSGSGGESDGIDSPSDSQPYYSDQKDQPPADGGSVPEGKTPVSYPQKQLLTRRGSHSYLYFPTPAESVSEERTVLGPALHWRQHSDLISHLGVFSALLAPTFEFRSMENCLFEEYDWHPSHVVRTYECGTLRVIETTTYGAENHIAVRIRVQNTGTATAFAVRGRAGKTGLEATVQSDASLPGARMSMAGQLVNMWSSPVSVTWNSAITSSPPATSTEIIEDGKGWSLNFAVPEAENIDIVLSVEVAEGGTPTPPSIDPAAFYGLVTAIDDEIEAWFEQAPDQTAAKTSATYATAWYLFWENGASAKGNWTGAAIVPSKRQYFRGIWLWDAAFNALALAYGDMEARNLGVAQLEHFLNHPLGDGHLPREIWTTDINPGLQPPGVLTWALVLADQKATEAEQTLGLLSTHYDALRTNHTWFINNTDSDGDGLYEWSGTDSGWDTSPRWDEGPVEAVDLACWLYLDAILLSQMAQKLARLEDSIALADEAALLKERIQTLFWDANSGFFYDLRITDNTPVLVKTPATFMPLLVGAATPEQATAVASRLSDPALFATPFGLPSVAANEPSYDSDNYWRGPVWVVLNALTIWGLESYGFTTEAEALRTSTYALLAKSPTTYEYYDSQTGAGLGAPNFMWSGAFYILLQGESPLVW
jgi:hypothetical protein